ncbi:MAG: HesA/MoeB/ThiF family protein, partial [Pseudomonadota bacterium]
DDDFVLELRSASEAPVTAVPHAHRVPVSGIGAAGPLPQDHPRAVMVCRSGLRSWQAARRLRPHWPGEIVLAAMGD